MMSLSTLLSPNPSLKSPHITFKLSWHTTAPVFTNTHNQPNPFRSSKSLSIVHAHGFSGSSSFSKKKLGLSFDRKNIMGFVMKAENGEGMEKGVVGVDKAKEAEEKEEEARGQSTMPERFRHLTKEAPDKPLRWPWFIALAFLVYAWRTVLWELSNWKKAVAAIIHFLGYISKLALALIFHFIGDPTTSLIRGIETALYAIRAFYSGVVKYAPVPELTMIIMLASAVLATAEAAVPDAVNSQPYLLTIAGLIGFAAVRGYISELFFWTLLLGLFGFARFIKKRDYVSSALPVAAVLAAIGEPWVRVLVMASYLALAMAITHHSKKSSEGKEVEVTSTSRRVPIPLLCAAMAIGVRVAAKWAGYRHLTWMIV